MGTIALAPGGRILSLFSDDLDEYPLLPASIELTIENLFPWSEIQFAVGYRHQDLASHDLPFDVSVGIVLAGIVMPILIGRFVRHETFEKIVVVLEQPGFIVIDVDTRADVHRVYEAQSFLDATLL